MINIFSINNDSTSNNYRPNSLKNIIGSKDALFVGNEAQDAKDLLLFLIETMNAELNGGISPIYNDILRLRIDARDQMKIKQTFLNDFNRKNFSPFSKILYGFCQSCSSCQRCNTKRYTYECFNSLIFSLSEIKYHISRCDNNNSHILNLSDCFEFYQKYEIFEGDNQILCPDCNSMENNCIQRKIDITPPVLIIVLDRGPNNMNFQERFDFDEYLDLNNFVTNNTNNYTQYFLSGVITHIGESGLSGHYIAFCKMDIQSPWYSYSDSSVKKCQDQREIFKTGVPYILFYHYFNN